MKRIEGIYGILPADLRLDELLNKAEAALKGGVRLLQLRDKKQGFKHLHGRARRLHELTARFQARLIINDSIQAAVESGAEGVHLGRDDAPNLTRLRAESGNDLIIGISCKADAAFARHALDSGADYVSFGAIFSTQSKASASVIGIDRLAKARQLFPADNIVAIGGIDASNLIEVKAAGADAAAVINGLFDADDVASQARRLLDLWQATS
ncbi:MAG: thiamine phosphate synthase [Mariprofundaceae bacterium]